MRINKYQNRKKLVAIFFSFALVFSHSVIAHQLFNSNQIRVDAAEYSGGGSGFSKNSDGSVSATFGVTDNNLDMRGWLLCLYSSKPSVDSSNKLVGSNDKHPYSDSSVIHYFFASNTQATGNINVTWAGNSGDQKQNWTASTSTGASGQTLKDYLSGSTVWHIVVGPRHYNSTWGGSGIGAGKDNYWENCDYYIGPTSEVFPTDDKDMTVSVTNYSGTYDGEPHSITINPTDPSSGYSISYRETSSGDYNLTQLPTYTEVCSKTVYFKITKTGYKDYTGSGTVIISKADAIYTAPTAKTNLVYDGTQKELVNAGTSNVLYSLDGTNYSSSVPKGTDAKQYTVYYKVEATTNYKGVDPKTIAVSISKGAADYIAPEAITGLVYSGEEQQLVSGGSSNVLYSLDNVNYSSDIPTGMNAKNYTVYYKVEETSNRYGFGPESIDVYIDKANPIYEAPIAKTGLVYNEDEQELVTAGSSNILYSLDDNTYSSVVPKGTNAGQYTVYYKIEETDNYYGLDVQSFDVVIDKAGAKYITPIAKTDLIYSGNEQELVSGGSSNVLYSLDNDTYSSDIPTGVNAGTYNIYYKIEETDNRYSFGPEMINVTINKAQAVFNTTPTAKLGLSYTAESHELINAGKSSGGTVLYSFDGEDYFSDVPTETLVGEYTIYYKIEGDSNYIGVDAKTIKAIIHPNDKTALNAVIEEAKKYFTDLMDKYPEIANKLNNEIIYAEAISDDDNKTIEEIGLSKDDLIYAYDLAHAEVVDTLIESIGDVRLTDKCLDDIEAAEEAFKALSEDQQALVNDLNKLESDRDLYDRLEDVANVINEVGDVTYSEESKEKIEKAKEAFNSLTPDEQNLIPTLSNELSSDEDIYNMLGLIANLGDVTYSEEYLQALNEARNAYDALDYNEQQAIYNYQSLVDAEESYKRIDEVVNLVNNIDEELEYVGTHNPEIDAAKEAYDALSENEKKLVPLRTKSVLETSIEEYEELKVEHERKEVEDREAGVAIAIEGASGIPNTVSIDINNSQSNDKDFTDNIDYQTINESIGEDEEISSVCEIKFYEEVEGEMVEVSLSDIDEGLSLTIKIDVPLDVDDTNFKIVLLDGDNNIIELDYTYDPVTRQATVVTSEVGTFAIISEVITPTVATEGLPGAIIGAIAVSGLILFIAFIPLINKRKKI